MEELGLMGYGEHVNSITIKAATWLRQEQQMLSPNLWVSETSSI